MGGQTICLQAVPARMSCDDVLEWVGEEVLKEYKNLHHNRGLLGHSDRGVHSIGEEFGEEAAMDPAGSEGAEGCEDDHNEDEPAEMAVCALVANNLHRGSNRGTAKLLQQKWKKRIKKESRRIGAPRLSFGECIRTHPPACFVCHMQNAHF